jgi:pimeloyl-ACP methyl ester carboxylesterase
MPEIARNGVKIHFEDSGEGPAVVLGHSFLCSGEMWAPQVPDLVEANRVINVDLRGHGRSSPLTAPCEMADLVDDVLAVLDHLGLANAILAGLSIGGMVAMRVALEAPERVRALVLADTHAGGEKLAKKTKYRLMTAASKVVGLRPFLPSVLRLMFGATTLRIEPALVAEWKSRFSEVDLPSIGIVLEALVRRDSVLERLHEISVPTLVIVGEEDASLPVGCSREIAQAIEGASLVVVPRAGHLSTLEQPEIVARAMRDFIRGLD